MRRAPALAAAVLVLAAGTAAGVPTRRAEPDPAGSYDLPRIAPAPDFSLVDAATGRRVGLADFAGRPLLLSFIYTRCPDARACPLASRVLADVQARVEPGSVALASVTFDPDRDDAAALVRYARAHGADPAVWRMLRPPDAAEGRRLAEGFDHRAFRQADGSFTHPLRVYLIDGDGWVRQIYSQGFLDPRVVTADVETLRREARRSRRARVGRPPEIVAVAPPEEGVAGSRMPLVAVSVSYARCGCGPGTAGRGWLRLDGREVLRGAALSGAAGAPRSDAQLLYTPDAPLTPGRHHAEAHLESGDRVVRYRWSFEVR